MSSVSKNALDKSAIDSVSTNSAIAVDRENMSQKAIARRLAFECQHPKNTFIYVFDSKTRWSIFVFNTSMSKINSLKASDRYFDNFFGFKENKFSGRDCFLQRHLGYAPNTNTAISPSLFVIRVHSLSRLFLF